MSEAFSDFLYINDSPSGHSSVVKHWYSNQKIIGTILEAHVLSPRVLLSNIWGNAEIVPTNKGLDDYLPKSSLLSTLT